MRSFIVCACIKRPSGAYMRHFIEYAILRGLGALSLYGARGEALWQEMV